MDGPGDTDLSVAGVCFPDIAKCGLPYVPAVFAFMTFAGALKSRLKMWQMYSDIRAHCLLSCFWSMCNLDSLRGRPSFLGNNMELITGMVLEFAVPTAVVSLMWVTIMMETVLCRCLW